MHIPQTIRNWISPSSSSSDGEVPPPDASSSRPRISLQGASVQRLSAETSAVAASVFSASVVASSVSRISLQVDPPPASQSTDTATSNASLPHRDSLTSPETNPVSEANIVPEANTVPEGNTPAGDSGPNTQIQPRLRAPSAAASPAPHNELGELLDLGAHCALSIAQVAAELAPIPYIGPLVECLTFVFQAIERAKVNKEQWKLLQGRCVMVIRIAGTQVLNHGGQRYPGVEEATRTLEETLNNISNTAQRYNEMNPMVVFLQFQSISDEIQGLFGDLDACLTLFSFAANVAQLQWVEVFRNVQERELAELRSLRSLLVDMNTNIDTIGHNVDTINQNSEEIKRIVNVLQDVLIDKSNVLQNQATTTHANYVEAQQVVRTILAVTNLKLPPKLLAGQQCILDPGPPIKTGITCDIYSASFLGGEKVAKKVFRIGMSDQEFVRRYAQRFLRIAELWSGFRSEYTLEFYGVGMESFGDDEHFQLYMVSPLMKNFDAVTYLKQYRTTAGMKKSILRIITDAALGLQYLHSRNPPVVHSGMRGDNILITDSGGGMLGGFGLTKALESGGNDNVPPAVMTGKTESQRWMAPELFDDDTPVLKTSADVWGWAMTALEIVSGSVPYHSHTQALTVMLKVKQGPPKRKDHIKFEEYAYRPDEMWELLERCWNETPEERPTIDDVVARLKVITQMEEYVKQ